MKIVSLKIKEGIADSFDSFSPKTNLVHSLENSKGKSTYFRLLFHALGFQIPEMKGVKYTQVETSLTLSVKNKTYIIERITSIIKCTNIENGEVVSFSLPIDHTSFMCMILDYHNVAVVKNLLGILYLDQDKGWTLLNRGTVIGRIKFNIEELVAGLNNVDCSELLFEKKQLEIQLNKYKIASDAIDLREQLIEQTGEVSVSDKEKELSSGVMLAKSKVREIENKIKDLNKVIDQEESFFDFIDNMSLEVRKNDVTIAVNRDTVVYNHSADLFKARKSVLATQLYYNKKELKEKQSMLDNFYLENNIMTNLMGDRQDRIIERQIASFNIDQATVQTLLEQTQKRYKEVKVLIKNKLRGVQNPYTSKIYKLVLECAKRLNIDEKMVQKEDFIFTNDLKSLGGAVLQKMVFCFKVAFLKIIEEVIGINLFVVFDSPRGKELDDKNAEALFKIIQDELKDTQIFIASIYQFGCEKKIELKERAIESRIN